MSKNLKVVFVGLPGSGKSTFGKQIAAELNIPFFDLDSLIESKYQMKIPEIFSNLGEGKFREWETATLKEFLQKDESYILASGGGCPCFNDNMELINKESISVFLDVPLEEISARLGASKAHQRPMFQGLDQGEITLKLRNLLFAREPFYELAKIKLSGEDFSAELLVSELIHMIKNSDQP